MGAQIHAIDSVPVLPMVELHRRLSAWRAAGRPGQKIPHELWSAAVEHARSGGVRPTAMTLGLDSGKLRRLLREATAESPQLPTPSGSVLEARPPAQESPRFLELPRGSVGPGPVEPASIELAFPDGRRITVRGMGHDTVVALFQTFWTADR